MRAGQGPRAAAWLITGRRRAAPGRGHARHSPMPCHLIRDGNVAGGPAFAAARPLADWETGAGHPGAAAGYAGAGSAGRVLRSSRRCSGVVPPQMPAGSPARSAQSRHGAATGHRAQTALAAAIWTAAGPDSLTGKNKSGSTPGSRQDARAAQEEFVMACLHSGAATSLPHCRGGTSSWWASWRTSGSVSLVLRSVVLLIVVDYAVFFGLSC
jgi:hypothetical protein